MTQNADAPEALDPFLLDLGARLIEATASGSVVELRLDRRHLNRFDFVHGGVIMTLLDFTMAQACRAVDAGRRPPITVEMKTAFVQPGRGLLRCEGHCLHHAGSLAFGEARIADASGALVAFASGTFKYMNT